MTENWRLLPYGDRAVLVEFDDPAPVPAARAALAALPGVVESVAGACTVLAVAEPSALARVPEALASIDLGTRCSPAPPAHAPGDGAVELPVVYDGADLAELADETGLGVQQIVALHAGTSYIVRFCGFSPGFAYLDGLDPRLHVPRRAEPRTSVPAGSVGVAGAFTGVYPRPSAGGWRLIGRTDAALWDVLREPPALLVPGTVVRFVPT